MSDDLLFNAAAALAKILIFIHIALALGATGLALIASWGPARRVSRVQIQDALRS